MYSSFFGLSAKPFTLTPDPEFLYLSRTHKEALAHLSYGVESKSGFVMVTGEVGAGKTTLIRTLIQSLSENITLSQVTNTRVSYRELLELILEDFGLRPRGLNKTGLLSSLNDFLIEQYQEGKNCVVVVDEAQNLSVQTLEGLRMLSNLETEKAKLLHVVLSGQPGLRQLIDSPELEQLRQRITVRYHLGPLSVGETGEYIRHRLGKVITDTEKAPIFSDEVVPRIHEVTGGIPRLINVLCDSALLHGYVEETRDIHQGIVEEVAEQIYRDQRGEEHQEREASDAVDPSVEARISQIEARLEQVLGGGTLPRVVAGSEDAAEVARDLEEQGRKLAAREKEFQDRLADLEKREKDLEQRVSLVKQQWKKRLGSLEVARQRALDGQISFPRLKVYAFEPDPRTQNTIEECLEAGGMDAEVFARYEEFERALSEAGAGHEFAVAVIGSDLDDAVNAERVARVSKKLGHVPSIFLSDIDLSTVRRRIFGAGANFFLEKPNGRAASFASHREATQQLKSDLIRAVTLLYRQYETFFSQLLGGDSAVEPPLGNQPN